MTEVTKEASPLAKELMAHAEAHYNDGGWDVIVECWELQQIDEVLAENGATTLTEAVAGFAFLVGVWADRQADAMNSAF